MPYSVLSIDPGYDRLGVAVIKKENGRESLVHSDCITSSKKLTHPKRLALIGETLKKLIGEYAPNAIAVEKLFFNMNQKTAFSVAESRGVILYEAGRADISVYEYTPGEIKAAVTGHGRSDKKQVETMVEKILSIKKDISYDDEYDAIAVGLAHMSLYRAKDLDK
ncbi:MAG: crossover junction endodeoxyribonuclease RuvC [Patescibacteria group bacterium]|nr:crossover junction endodeoxyribonuclease RuvC [bacterium]MDZ4240971.1 crossover junction endodeoxyribonuclease RuvC [Patescibacteria group bacterium]